MTGGGPANATDTFVTHAYRMAFRFLDFHIRLRFPILILLLSSLSQLFIP